MIEKERWGRRGKTETETESKRETQAQRYQSD